MGLPADKLMWVDGWMDEFMDGAAMIRAKLAMLSVCKEWYISLFVRYRGAGLKQKIDYYSIALTASLLHNTYYDTEQSLYQSRSDHAMFRKSL